MVTVTDDKGSVSVVTNDNGLYQAHYKTYNATYNAYTLKHTS